jgi:hypothetical protein
MPFGKKLENAGGNASVDGVIDGAIDVCDDGTYLGNRTTDELGGHGRARWPVGHKATKTDINR